MPTEWVVRPMEQADVRSVHALFSAALPEECWSLTAVEAELHQPQARVLVAVKGETVGGFLQVRHVLDEGDVLNLAVCANLRRQGIGRLLMEGLFALARQEGIAAYALEVRAANRQAAAFYERLGFVQVGRRAGFYRAPPDDALLYRLDLQSGQN